MVNIVNLATEEKQNQIIDKIQNVGLPYRLWVDSVFNNISTFNGLGASVGNGLNLNDGESERVLITSIPANTMVEKEIYIDGTIYSSEPVFLKVAGVHPGSVDKFNIKVLDSSDNVLANFTPFGIASGTKEITLSRDIYNEVIKIQCWLDNGFYINNANIYISIIGSFSKGYAIQNISINGLIDLSEFILKTQNDNDNIIVSILDDNNNILVDDIKDRESIEIIDVWQYNMIKLKATFNRDNFSENPKIRSWGFGYVAGD